MPRKAKAKRVGRPALSKDARREVRSIRLPGALWKRAEAFGEVTATIEKALTLWLDQWEGQGLEILARRTDKE
jgi:hypothetical protein